MADFIKWLLLAIGLGAIIWVLTTRVTTNGTSQMKGMNLVSYEADGYASGDLEADLSHLKSLGVNSVAFVVTWYQSGPHSFKIVPDKARTPTDDSLGEALDLAHQLGLKTFVRPLVDPLDGSWRGTISFSTPEQWAAWFESYRHFILRYASLAAAHQVNLFSVGVELEGTLGQGSEWHQTIDAVRAVFPGPVTYSANWDDYARVPFWQSVDSVGIDGYFNLDVPATSAITSESLLQAWRPWTAALSAFAREIDKPILLTELGVPSVRGNSRRPWDFQLTGPAAPTEQADYYAAAFRALWGKPWLQGIYWWAWSEPSMGNGPEDTSYSPDGKPAERVLRTWFAR